MIEILIVIGIIGILSAVAFGQYTLSQQKAKDASRKSDLTQIARALEVYTNDFGHYPASDTGKIMGCGSDGKGDCNWTGKNAFATIAPLSQTYMKVLPNDPSYAVGYRYFYSAAADGKSFYLCSTLDTQAGIDKAYRDDLGTQCTCGTATCHYKLTDSGVEMP